MSAAAPQSQAIKRTSASTPAKRSSTALPKPPLNLSSRCVIASHATLSGTQPMAIGAHVVLHPYARLSSTLAPVTVGEGCIIWEKVAIGVIETNVDSEQRAELVKYGTTLGKNVVIESMAHIEAQEIGEGSLIGSGAKIGIGCKIGKYCSIAPGITIPPYTRLPDFTVAMDSSRRRTNMTLKTRPEVLKSRDQNHQRQLDSLRILIQNNIGKWQ